MTLPFLWDYDIDENQFSAILKGELTIGRLDRNWAATRLLEYASYPEILHFLNFAEFLQGWPLWRSHIRSTSRLRSFDFLAEWLPAHANEWENA